MTTLQSCISMEGVQLLQFHVSYQLSYWTTITATFLLILTIYYPYRHLQASNNISNVTPHLLPNRRFRRFGLLLILLRCRHPTTLTNLLTSLQLKSLHSLCQHQLRQLKPPRNHDCTQSCSSTKCTTDQLIWAKTSNYKEASISESSGGEASEKRG